MSHLYDAVVIGSGVAGGSVAKALSDKNWKTLLFDRRSFPRHKVCGEFLSPEAQGGLYRLGLLDKVQQLEPIPIRQVKIILENGKTLDISLDETAWGVSRFVLDRMIQQEAALAGASVHTGILAHNIKQENDRTFTIEVRALGEKTVIRSRAVIGAWGGQKLGKQRKEAGTRTTYFGVKSHFTGIELNDTIELYFFPGGYMGLAPVQNGTVNASALLQKDAFQQSDKSVLAMLKEAASRNLKLAAKLQGAVPVTGTEAAIAPVTIGWKMNTWDRIPLVGDSMLTVPPLCGDGMSMALRSAYVCSTFADDYLRGECSLEEWHVQYTRSIRKQFNGPLRWGLRLQGLSERAMLPTVVLQAAHMIPGLADFFIRATRLQDDPYVAGNNKV